MSLNPIVAYRDTIIRSTVTILAGQTQSSTFNATTTALGQVALRRIVTPSVWTTCDVTFRAIDDFGSDSLDILQTSIHISDGIAKSVYTLPNVVAGQTISVVPYAFDSIGAFLVVCSVAQTLNTSLGLILEPIYQGVA